jgi:hypothetical protein
MPARPAHAREAALTETRHVSFAFPTSSAATVALRNRAAAREFQVRAIGGSDPRNPHGNGALRR